MSKGRATRRQRWGAGSNTPKRLNQPQQHQMTPSIDTECFACLAAVQLRLERSVFAERHVATKRLLRESQLAHLTPQRRAADPEDARRLVTAPAARLERAPNPRRIDRR